MISWKENGMVKKTDHLGEDQIIEAVIDERNLERERRLHLFECSSCRARKDALQGSLTRLGQISRGETPADFRKPRIIRPVATGPWILSGIRPALGAGIAFAALLVLLLSPLTLKRDTYTLDRVYTEMRQDEVFISEIEKLEDNPLPKIYVDMGDPGDDETPPPQGAIRYDDMNKDGGPRDV